MKAVHVLKSLLVGSVLAIVASVSIVPMAYAVDARVQVVAKTYDPASQATLTGTSTTVTVPGAVLGDECGVSSSIDTALITASCYVSAAGVVTIRLFNGTAGTIDLASSTWRVFVFPRGSR